MSEKDHMGEKFCIAVEAICNLQHRIAGKFGGNNLANCQPFSKHQHTPKSAFVLQ